MPRDQVSPPEDADRRSADLQRLQRIASVHFLFGQHEKAEKLLRLAHWLAPEDHSTSELLAASLFWRDERDEGRKIIEELERSGASAPAWLSKYSSQEEN